MHVLFIVLKILGFFLLFLLFLLILILITPVRYQFQIKKESEQPFEGQVRVTWLLAVVSVAAGYIGQALEYQVRIFGIQILGNQPAFLEQKEKKQKKKAEKSRRKENKKKASEEETEAISGTGDEEPELEALSVDEVILEESDHPTGEQTAKASDESIDAPEREKPEGKAQKKSSKKEKAKPKEEAQGKVSSLINKAKEWKAFYDEIHGRELIQIAWDTVLRVLKHILPRKLSGYIRFGLDDPASTGYVTAAAAVFYPVYRKHFTFEPDFQEKCFEANCRGKGRIRPGFFLYIVIRLLLKKTIRNLIKVMRNQ